MDTGLAGKTILVTGAAGGIGMATSTLLAKEGANVILHYRTSEERAKNLEKKLVDLGTKPMRYRADLSKEVEVKEMFSEIKKQYGKLDGLVNNAGIWPEIDTPIHKMSLEQWEDTLNINLKSIFLCSKEFLVNLKEFRDNYGSIILIGSTAGVIGEAGHIDYSASKAALHGVMLSLKNEIVQLARYGRVNIVSPGWTLTPMARGGLSKKESVTKVLQTTALRKIGRAEDIANSIVFLLSDKLSAHTSGQHIVISGGMEGRVLYQKDEVDPDNIIID